MLESSIAKDIYKGLVKVGNVFLTCGKEEGCLFVPSGTDKYVAYQPWFGPVATKIDHPKWKGRSGRYRNPSMGEWKSHN